MSLKISEHDDFSEALRSVIKAECDHAHHILKTKTNKPHDTIHEVRKSFKKIRGALRLIRDHVPYYKQENVFFRDEGRKISEIRDATAVIETLDLIHKQYNEQIHNKTFKPLRKHLIKRRDEMANEVLKKDKVLKTIKDDMEGKCPTIERWEINISSFDDIKKSINRVYKRGRKAYKKAKTDRESKNFHEWRKRVKYLRYQLDILNRIWPHFLKTWENELHTLSDILGTEHDLHILNGIAKDYELEATDNGTSEYLINTLIETHKNQMQHDALLLGQRLYHLHQNEFVSLLEASWEAFEMENQEADLLVN